MIVCIYVVGSSSYIAVNLAFNNLFPFVFTLKKMSTRAKRKSAISEYC